jgi:hypothetical protein
MPSLDPEKRRQTARAAAAARWAKPGARERAGKQSRQSIQDRFLDRVPPEVTDPDERARLAQDLLREEMARKQLAGFRARLAAYPEVLAAVDAVLGES